MRCRSLFQSTSGSTPFGGSLGGKPRRIPNSLSISSSCCNLLVLSKNFPRFSQSHISKLIIPSVRYLSDKGHSLIPLLLTEKCSKHFISGWTLGNFSTLGHFRRKKRLFTLRVLGRIWSFMQSQSTKHSSLSRSLIESWISIKFSQQQMYNDSKFGAHKSGNLVMDWHLSKQILFKYL